MMIGRTPWETEAEIYSHGEFWMDYYRKAAAETIGSTPDRTIIEEDVSWVPNLPRKYRLRMEWDRPDV